jgi:signal peptidase I
MQGNNEKVVRQSKKRSTALFVRDVLIALLIIIVILQLVRPTIVFEHSMENTLMPKDYVFLFKQAYVFDEIGYGDIVVSDSTLLDERGVPKSLIKRVIGLPGDVIQIKNDAVYRNGERLYETYTKDGYTTGEFGPVTVPAGSVFLLGDNREVSKDSRHATIGFIPKDEIRGKVIFRLFPISSMGLID